ncbi:hypothetical protein A0H81_02284 [Grifola frondosa]|uniref:Uncharacterized protein n=1 Tax=Grifola frondosa TaxID=5627 RepID=A0A1C7MN98_GRIFR|nr:hypothetical protein A0H81_02284 [Grifola frondosa]
MHAYPTHRVDTAACWQFLYVTTRQSITGMTEVMEVERTRLATLHPQLVNANLSGGRRFNLSGGHPELQMHGAGMSPLRLLSVFDKHYQGWNTVELPMLYSLLL